MSLSIDDKMKVAADVLGGLIREQRCPGQYWMDCPGADMHSNPDGRRDCVLYLDEGGKTDAPTIHCFHRSCLGVVQNYNYKLRSAIGRFEAKKDGSDGRDKGGKSKRKPFRGRGSRKSGVNKQASAVNPDSLAIQKAGYGDGIRRNRTVRTLFSLSGLHTSKSLLSDNGDRVDEKRPKCPYINIGEAVDFLDEQYQAVFGEFPRHIYVGRRYYQDIGAPPVLKLMPVVVTDCETFLAAGRAETFEEALENGELIELEAQNE